MPNYNQSHAFYAGALLHARSMVVHVLSNKGKSVFERDLPAEPDAFLDAVKPFRKNIVVGCECMFAWFWLADLCEDKRTRPRKAVWCRHIPPLSLWERGWG